MNKFQERYARLGHAIQSGIAFCIEAGWRAAEPKHLRVGIDTSKSDHGALAKLLIEKGVFTEEEYGEALLEGLEKEVAGFEELYKELTGAENVTFK